MGQDQFYTYTMFDVQGAFALGTIAEKIKKGKGIVLPEKNQMDANIKHWQELESKLEDDEQMIDFQTDYVEQLRKYPFVCSLYPLSYDTSDIFKRWEHDKKAPNQGLATYRDKSFQSIFTKNSSPIYPHPWIKCFDDSKEQFL